MGQKCSILLDKIKDLRMEIKALITWKIRQDKHKTENLVSHIPEVQNKGAHFTLGGQEIFPCLYVKK